MAGERRKRAGTGIARAREHLPFVDARVNELAPPPPFEDASFDLCYALSVFTHLPAELQRPWIEELRRVVRPGGILILSLHGDAYAPRLSPEGRARYDAGELVVLQAEHPGTNFCATLHPPAYVRDHLAAGFRLLSHAPEGARGNPRQDLYVFERLKGSSRGSVRDGGPRRVKAVATSTAGARPLQVGRTCPPRPRPAPALRQAPASASWRWMVASSG